MSNGTSSLRLHRVLRAPPERVYRAIPGSAAAAKRLPPHGFTGKAYEIDVRVGGGYRMSITNFGAGTSHACGGRSVELTPHERIRYTDRFDDPALPGGMQVAITPRRVVCGAELEILQEGVPAVLPVEVCYIGWQESPAMLGPLVEPEFPDGA